MTWKSMQVQGALECKPVRTWPAIGPLYNANKSKFNRLFSYCTTFFWCNTNVICTLSMPLCNTTPIVSTQCLLRPSAPFGNGLSVRLKQRPCVAMLDYIYSDRNYVGVNAHKGRVSTPWDDLVHLSSPQSRAVFCFASAKSVQNWKS